AGAERLCPQWQESWHTPWRAGNEYENDDESDRKPTFGFMPNDGIVVPHPPVARALEIVKQTLTNADFESGEPIFPEIVNVSPAASADLRFHSQSRPVDVVIAPAGPHSAIPPGKFIQSAYTSALNVLNFCIAVMPITVADKNLDTLDPNFQPLADKDRRNMPSYGRSRTLRWHPGCYSAVWTPTG
ncbi:hypothetical protein QC764_305665, partial [Podospora pseudoanserina]